MENQKLKRNPSCLKVGFFLGRIALLLVLFQISANAAQQGGEGSAESQRPVQHYVWIQDPYSGDTVLTNVKEPDQSLWNAQRVTDYEESLKVDAAPALGVLTIDKVNIQVPIYNGTDEFNLNRGAGRIKGMARMDEDGNLAISGHRDGFFRGLKDLEEGDDIEVQTTRGVESYVISSITIVDKADISPLEPTSEKTLTLITCYPFYFVGHAPKRYIVKASPKLSLAEAR